VKFHAITEENRVYMFCLRKVGRLSKKLEKITGMILVIPKNRIFSENILKILEH